MFFACLVLWGSDIFALFGGRVFGKTPLTSLSPKKTWEGTLIGYGACLLMTQGYVWFVNGYYNADLNGVTYLVFAAILGVASQLGDLHESLIKRHFKVKDSSQLLPGHGGFYDRADSALFVMPLAFFFFNGII